MNVKTQTATALRSTASDGVRFEIFHPTAKRVCVAGSFNGWSPTATPMAPAGHGRWLRELWLPPGEHEYLLVVDGKWLFDPMAADYVPNVFGGMNAVVGVRLPAKPAGRRAAAILPSFGTGGTKKGIPSPNRAACFA